MLRKIETNGKYEFKYADLFEMAEKINEIIDIIQSKKPREVDFSKRIGDFDEREGGYVDDEEWEVIKKCLRYCSHSLTQHRFSGLHIALSQEDKKVFKNLLENLS